MNRNYKSPRALISAGAIESLDALEIWADERGTHAAVAAAIHSLAIASDYSRSADEVWEDPTNVEFEWVRACVAEYIERGDFLAHEDGRYCWGCAEVIQL